ncbi:MAG TPA: hypothetical protein VEW08_16820 [Steroidobacteraceae bacterium]|nr:hypothetical protein [Steroidobacteraceae bacterium]
MSSFIYDLITLLGKKSDDPEVVRAIEKHQLNDVYDDPPLWRYVGSKVKGTDLLFEEECVVDVQVHAQATKRRDAIPGELPFGLKKGMTQRQVHAELGTPYEADTHDSRYRIANPAIRLLVAYDESGVVRYLSIAPPEV